MAYRFVRTTSSYIEFAIAPLSGYTLGPFTFAIFLKFAETFGRDWFAIADSSLGYRAHVGDDGALTLRWIDNAGSGLSASGGTQIGTTQWMLIVVTCSASGATPRFHVHNGTSWNHANGNAVSQATTVGASDRLRLASRNPGSGYQSCDIVCAGIKKGDSSDSAVQTLTRTAFQDWRNFGFDWLVGFDSSLASGGVIQDQASPGTGDEVAKAATSVVSDPSGWAWTSVTAPVADFTGTPLNGIAPYTVTFTDASTNTPTSWAWTFGDGGTSTSQNPTHSYTVPGVYTVALVATNTAGSDTKTRTGYVTVASGFVPQIVIA